VFPEIWRRRAFHISGKPASGKQPFQNIPRVRRSESLDADVRRLSCPSCAAAAPELRIRESTSSSDRFCRVLQQKATQASLLQCSLRRRDTESTCDPWSFPPVDPIQDPDI